MPVFDFSGQTGEDIVRQDQSGTYEVFASSLGYADAEHPLLVLDGAGGMLSRHVSGFFANPEVRSCFHPEGTVGNEEGGAALLRVDSRFVSLIQWLGRNRIHVRLSCQETAEGYAVYKIRETLYGNGAKLSGEDGFLQFMIRRLLASAPVDWKTEEEEEDPEGDELRLTSLTSITDFLACAGKTLPDNIRLWARRNLAVAKSPEVSQEERRHAQHALSIMMNVQWKSDYFESIDAGQARRILDEELYGMEKVKQRIMETIIQINRTHTLPSYGLLLAGPAGTGKSQVAYAVARILRLPWTTLDMSSINDPEQLTGSSRVYSNAKPGIIMEAFQAAGESNLVVIINELDKADAGNGKGNPADVLLTLLDNLGFTDNYMECMIPTMGVYPIATANDKDKISAPLLSRFAVIDIPDYTPEEKKLIFSRYALPKVLRKIGLKEEEFHLTEEAVDSVIDHYAGTTGIRDLEQAAEHLAANALYRIEVDKMVSVTFDGAAVKDLL